MSKHSIRVLLVSDFNTDVFRGYLNNDQGDPRVESVGAPFGQVVPVLMDPSMACWRDHPDCALVWTQPESVIPSFGAALRYEPVSMDQILSEVDAFSRAIIQMRERVRCAFVAAWVLPSYHRGYGMLDMKTGVGITNLLMRMNLRLADNLVDAANVWVLDAQRWTQQAGRDASNPKLWYLGKIPFHNDVFKGAARDLKAALRGLSGAAKKLIVVDLDDTLWGGVAGDVGWRHLNLGGHDPIGEAFVDFQHGLKALSNRGILLGIVSKNTESVALEAIRNHPEMVLRLEDFAGWRVNWDDKAQNIVDLAADLNLGLESVVFIDDNPVERARVKEALPEVFVPEWPENKMMFKSALLALSSFDTPSVSQEDRQRTQMYAAEGQRKSLRQSVGSMEEWLKTLQIRIRIEELNQANLRRTVQLLNKTNQMNLSTRRMTEAELSAWLKPPHRKLWTFRVSDKFGDSGLTGLLSVEVNRKSAQILDFVLSCRVIGRKVEETMLFTAIEYARSLELDEVWAAYVATPKNQPCLAFWRESGFAYDEAANRFTWRLRDRPYGLPEAVEIEGDVLKDFGDAAVERLALREQR